MTALLRCKPFYVLGLVGLACLFCWFPAQGAQSATPQPTKQILLLNSYHPGYRWNSKLIESMEQVLHNADVPVHVRYEFMDAKYYTTDAFVGELRNLYRQKYQNMRFDVIIASDNDAFHFVQRYRDELFPGASVVFCGVNGFKSDWLNGFANVTGTGENFDLRGTIEIALNMHPTAENLVLVGGVDTSSRLNRQLVKDLMPQFKNRVRFIDLSGIDVPDLLRELALVPKNSVLVYISYFLTPDGTRLTVEDSVALVAKASQLPMYTAWSYLLFNGMVGGKMLRAEDQGRTAAELAMRIVHGENPNDIPVLLHSPTYYMFDDNMLKKFGIEHERLPKDAVLVNQDQSLFATYRWLILGVLAFMLYQTAVIIGLLVSIRRRKRAEEQLRRDEALRMQLEEQLLHAQKLEAIDTFAGGIAHDFNNILECMTCCCKLALEELPPEAMASTDLRQAIRSSQRGKALIQRILDFSRKSPGRMEPVLFAPFMSECLSMLRPLLSANIELQCDIAPVPAICGDVDKLTQVLMNLLTNASQAMQSKGLLRISVDHVHEASLAEGTLHNPLGYVRLQVADTGCGMVQDVQNRIFDPFFTTNPKGEGTGLGLSVVHGLVRLHQGIIRVDSAVGRGTTFVLLFPVMPEPTITPGQAAALIPVQRCHSESLLLVDDDECVLRPLARLLERQGYRVTPAVSATEALSLVAQGGDFSLVLTDFDMPEINGAQMIARLQELVPDLPAILMTGLDRDRIPFSDAELLAMGIRGLVFKPLDHQRLTRIIRAVLYNVLPNSVFLHTMER